MSDGEDWPAPVEVINEAGASDIFLLCEHAANHMPAEYHQLGLPAHELSRHIAWDIGAAQVTRQLSALLDAPAFLGTYSRLLIDLNRPLQAADSIPAVSENTSIPGNIALAAEEVNRRISTMFTPFHRRVETYLDFRRAAGRTTRLLSIHSFTPVFKGAVRPWHAGILFDRAANWGLAMMEGLQGPNLVIGTNVPYKTDRAGDYGIPIHGDDRGIPAIMIEIRNDLIDHPDGVIEWAHRIAGSL